MELEDAVAVAAAAREAAAAVNATAWGALRTRRVSGKGGGGAACRSWAACPGRSASRKQGEEEEGRW